MSHHFVDFMTPLVKHCDIAKTLKEVQIKKANNDRQGGTLLIKNLARENLVTLSLKNVELLLEHGKYVFRCTAGF
jgi:hypothetical protein